MADPSKRENPPAAAQAKGVIETVKDAAKDVASGVADAAGAAKEKARDLASGAAGKIQDVAAATSELTVQAKDQVQEWTEKAGEVAQDLGKELTALVRRYPVPALLAGVAVGFLLGRATTARS